MPLLLLKINPETPHRMNLTEHYGLKTLNIEL